MEKREGGSEGQGQEREMEGERWGGKNCSDGLDLCWLVGRSSVGEL